MMSADDGLPSPSPDETPPNKDFARLRGSGEAAGASLAIGAWFVASRDKVARRAIGIGFTPNRMTMAGFAVTCAAAYCLMRGAGDQVPYFYNGEGPTSWWPALAAFFLILAGASDMLDGAIARVGHMQSRFGAILDSTLDRFGDMAIFMGCLLCFAIIGNVTLQALALAAMCNSFMISYVKARAEDIIDDCTVGYWLRGERFAAVLIGCLTGHVIAVIWQLAILNAFTVWRRIDYARRVIASQDRQVPPPPQGPSEGWWGMFQLWRRPRGSIAYDVVTGTNILFIVASPWVWAGFAGRGLYADPVRSWLGG